MERIIMNEVHQFEMNCNKLVAYLTAYEEILGVGYDTIICNLYIEMRAQYHFFNSIIYSTEVEEAEEGTLSQAVIINESLEIPIIKTIIRVTRNLTGQISTLLIENKTGEIKGGIAVTFDTSNQLPERKEFSYLIENILEVLETIVLNNMNSKSKTTNSVGARYVAFAIHYLQLTNKNKQRQLIKKYYSLSPRSVESMLPKTIYRSNRVFMAQRKDVKKGWKSTREILVLEKASKEILKEFDNDHNEFLREK